MKHQVKKIKFRCGKDANRALMRKLCVNFISNGSLTTTEAKAKAVKSLLDKVVSRAAEGTEASKRFILQQIGRKDLANALMDKVGPKVKDIRGGYVSLKRAHVRVNDGSQMVVVRWAHDIAGLMREEAVPAKNKNKMETSAKAPKQTKEPESPSRSKS